MARLPTKMRGMADIKHSKGWLYSSLFVDLNRDAAVSKVDTRAGHHVHSRFCGSIWDWTKTRHKASEQSSPSFEHSIAYPTQFFGPEDKKEGWIPIQRTMSNITFRWWQLWGWKRPFRTMMWLKMGPLTLMHQKIVFLTDDDPPPLAISCA